MSPTTLLQLPGIDLLLASSGRLGASWDGGPPEWGAEPLPLPVRAVRTEDDVGYLHMWSGITDAALPARIAGGWVCWLVDGEEQPVRVVLTRGNGPQADWP